MKRPVKNSTAVLMVIGSCASLQFGAAFAAGLIDELGATLTTAMRLLIAAALLGVLFRPSVRGWGKEQWIAVAWFGVAMAGMNGFFYAAIARIPLGVAVTIEFAGPLLLAATLSRRTRDLVCAIAAGAAIITLGISGQGGSGRLDRWGIAYALVAAAFWALYILAAKHLGGRTQGQGALGVGMLLGGAVVLPFATNSMSLLAADWTTILPLIVVAVMSSLIPYTLEFKALRQLDPRAFGVLLSLEPVVAALAGWMLLNQALTRIQLLAMAVVISASVISTLSVRQAATSSPPQRCTPASFPPR